MMSDEQFKYLYEFRNPFTGAPAYCLNRGAFLPPETAVHSGARIVLGSAEGVQSHFFGVPRFVGDWPVGPNGPLQALISIRFEDLTEPPSGMPRSGWLTVFYDLTADCVGGFTARDSGGSVDSKHHWLITIAPEDTPPFPSVPQQAVREAIPIRFAKGTEPPDDRTPVHTLGGTPIWIQGDERPMAHFLSGHYMNHESALSALVEAGLKPEAFMTSDEKALLDIGRALERCEIAPERFHRGVAEWQLLLQIDNDVDLGLTWTDAGRLFVLIPTDSLVKQQFADAWIRMQCY